MPWFNLMCCFLVLIESIDYLLKRCLINIQQSNIQCISSGSTMNWIILKIDCSFYYFFEVVEAADVILEVLDARDPLGCRCPQVEQAVIQSGTNKKIVLVLNKIGRVVCHVLLF